MRRRILVLAVSAIVLSSIFMLFADQIVGFYRQTMLGQPSANFPNGESDQALQVGTNAKHVVEEDDQSKPVGSDPAGADNGTADISIIKRLAEAGDAIAQRRLSDLYDRCAMFSYNPVEHVAMLREMAAKYKPQAVAAIEQQIKIMEATCPAIDGGQVIPLTAIQLWLEEAAKNGDLIARLRLAARAAVLKPMPKDEFNQLVDDVRARADPDEIFEMAELMRSNIDGQSPLLSGSEAAVRAWTIAACRRGAAACRAGSSRLLDSLCLTSLSCNYTTYEQLLMQEMISPEERGMLDARLNEIALFMAMKNEKTSNTNHP